MTLQNFRLCLIKNSFDLSSFSFEKEARYLAFYQSLIEPFVRVSHHHNYYNCDKNYKGRKVVVVDYSKHMTNLKAVDNILMLKIDQ